MELREDLIRLLCHELELLGRAVDRLLEETSPATRIPKYPCFKFVKAPMRYQGRDYVIEFIWPCRGEDIRNWKLVACTLVYVGAYEITSRDGREKLATYMLKAVGDHPDKILGAVRKIRSARAWCERARERRLMAARRILRRQEDVLRVLKDEIAAMDLAAGQG